MVDWLLACKWKLLTFSRDCRDIGKFFLELLDRMFNFLNNYTRMLLVVELYIVLQELEVFYKPMWQHLQIIFNILGWILKKMSLLTSPSILTVGNIIGIPGEWAWHSLPVDVIFVYLYLEAKVLKYFAYNATKISAPFLLAIE